MKKIVRVVLLFLVATAQVSALIFVWRAFQQTSDILWALRMGYKELVLEAKGITVDFEPDRPLFAPVFLILGTCALLTMVLLADEIRKRKDELLSSL